MVEKPVPKKLYKYRRINSHTQSIITENKIYFSGPGSFNDPYDCRMAFSSEGSLEESRSWCKNFPRMRDDLMRQNDGKSFDEVTRDVFPHRERLISNEATEELGEFVAQTGVFCLTEFRDSILMWSHYADYHRGICLEFATGIDVFKRPHLFDVTYGTELPTFRWLNPNHDQLARNVLGRKSPEWEYEEEWRIIYTRGAYTSRSFNPRALTGVILGARISEEDQAKVKTWGIRHDPPLVVYRAHLKEGQFGLDIRAEQS